MSAMALPFYTIGHSTRTIEAFTGLLRSADVNLVADIRVSPMSKTNPQYKKAELARALATFKVAYDHIAELGGLRGKAKLADSSVNGFWKNQSFHNYADYALTDSFREGLEILISLGRERRCAMMCSEALWWRCHRRLVADHLIARGERVFHLMGNDRIEAATLTDGARVAADGAVTYPQTCVGG